MKFIDSTEIQVMSGDGGDGAVSFRAARNLPKLGPDGGNGGHGGDVIFIGDSQLNTLSILRHGQVYRAEDGHKGGPNNCSGRCGEKRIVRVPLGTVVFESETNTKIGEIVHQDEELLVAKGGWRGIGNSAFTTSVQRAPRYATSGKKGEVKRLTLELKVLAHVGLCGFPNAGKSTLLSRITHAKPKIADYPFTTLVPQLGVVDLTPFGVYGRSFVVADIPGLIEGAAEGRGLGHQFLKHLERTRVILYLIDAFPQEEGQPSPYEQYVTLRKELKAYNPELAAKPALIVLNKADLFSEEHDFADILRPFDTNNLSCLQISAVSGQGLKDLIWKLDTLVSSEPAIVPMDLPPSGVTVGTYSV